jgi:hypothetical protein
MCKMGQYLLVRFKPLVENNPEHTPRDLRFPLLAHLVPKFVVPWVDIKWNKDTELTVSFP